MPKRALNRYWILACLVTFPIPLAAIVQFWQFMGWMSNEHPITLGDYLLAPLGMACILAINWSVAAVLTFKDRLVGRHKRVHPITLGDYLWAPLGVACILAINWSVAAVLSFKDWLVGRHKRGPGRRPP